LFDRNTTTTFFNKKWTAISSNDTPSTGPSKQNSPGYLGQQPKF